MNLLNSILAGVLIGFLAIGWYGEYKTRKLWEKAGANALNLIGKQSEFIDLLQMKEGELKDKEKFN